MPDSVEPKGQEDSSFTSGQAYSELGSPTPEARAEKPIEFPIDMQVAVPRTNGPVEYDWRVVGLTEDGEVIVEKDHPDGKQIMEKHPSPKVLASWQPKFNHGQHVRLDDGGGWQVASQGDNGIVVVVRDEALDGPEGDARRFLHRIPAAKLMLMQSAPKSESGPAPEPRRGPFRRRQ